MKKFKKKTKGITLIALVITIVILLMLAGISINLTIGQNGIIEKTKNAKNDSVIATEKENISLAMNSCKIDKPTENVTATDLKTELNNQGEDVTVTENGTDLIIKYNNTNHSYAIDQQGQVYTEEEVKEARLIIDGGFCNMNMDSVLFVQTQDGNLRITNNNFSLNSNEWTEFDFNNSNTINAKTIIKDYYGQLQEYSENDDLNIKTIYNRYDKFTITKDGKLYNNDDPISINDVSGSVLKGKQVVNIFQENYYGNILVIDSDGKVYTWGNNKYGQLGNGITQDSKTTLPECISNINNSKLKDKRIVKIYSYNSSVFALDENGRVYTWGNNSKGQLGDGTTTNSNTPICISDNTENALYGKSITQICIYDGTTLLALDTSGKIYMWGNNDKGQLGIGTTTNSNKPICISDIENYDMDGETISNPIYNKEITQVNNNSYSNKKNANVLDKDGNLYKIDLIPICLNDYSEDLYGKKVTEFFEGYRGIWAIDKDNNIYGWGSNYYGTLFTSDAVRKIEYPICLTENKNSYLYGIKAKKIYTSLWCNIAIITTDGRLLAWAQTEW